MSERKVLAKYYPPDFDPAAIGRTKKSKADKANRFATVRLMAPFSMKCTSCGEFIYRGRKFNARKEIPPDERYLNIQIFRFYIKCTRCSGEIVFKTDPRNMDYVVERGAKRNVDPWKRGLTGDGREDETDEERLDRIEREMAQAEGSEHAVMLERNAMEELEAKTADAKREMAVADALDTIRSRNARLARAQREGVEVEVLVGGVEKEEEERRRREEEEDEIAAKKAFAWAKRQEEEEEEVIMEVVQEEGEDEQAVEVTNGASSSSGGGDIKKDDDAAAVAVAGFVDSPAVAALKPAVKRAAEEAPPPTFEKRAKKPKKNYSALLGIKKKA
ncbi:CWC16 protein [Rhypophila decipiens]|uniref:Splicing factor YJU2 n=1 Tax=Rhypophila decipiens TaxID=261697 RepID=A0AAN7BDC3_9PEZI|nr:CWC16 protein [Rhypophila decipiens]